MLRRLHVDDDVYDAIVSSGDLTRGYVDEHRTQKVFHIGPERDHALFEGFGVAFGDVEDADYIVCSGLFDDETENAEDYRATLTRARERNLFFVCANPDIVVERGEKLIFCAGALAELYVTLGGKVLFAGKPHPPIYERALALAAKAGAASVSPQRVLAIGDFGPHRSRRRQRLGLSLPVRHLRHPCRRTRRARQSGRGVGGKAVRGRQQAAVRGDAEADVVIWAEARMASFRLRKEPTPSEIIIARSRFARSGITKLSA